MEHFTLWPFHVDKLKPPLKQCSEDGALDCGGNVCNVYPGVKDILSFLSEHFSLAVASRIEDIVTAYQILHFCNISDYFYYKEIYPTSKSTHLNRLRVRSGCRLNEMLFFDDDKRNVRDSNRIGVNAIQVTNGLSWNHIADGMRLFSQSHICKD